MSRRQRARCSPANPRSLRPGEAVARDAKKLSHIGKGGEAHMVDVSAKPATARVAVAEGRVLMQAKTLDIVRKGDAKKGDVLGTARLAGIMAAKRTHELIPLCHPLLLSQIEVEVTPDAALPGVRYRAGKSLRPDRRRDGSAHGRIGRLPHHL